MVCLEKEGEKNLVKRCPDAIVHPLDTTATNLEIAENRDDSRAWNSLHLEYYIHFFTVLHVFFNRTQCLLAALVSTAGWDTGDRIILIHFWARRTSCRGC